MSTTTAANGSMHILRESYPSKIVLTTEDLALLLTTTARTIRLAVGAGWWPIPHRRVGRRILFSLSAVAAYLDDGDAASQPSKQRRRGRPRKTAQIAL